MHTKKIIFCFLFLFIGAGCAPFPNLTPEYISPIDVKYRLNLMKNGGSENQNVGAGSLSFYQGFLSPVLNSNCRHYPTDSRYARMMFTKCSWLTSIIKTTSRYLSEPDGLMLYSYQTIENNRLYYVDLPEECSL